MKNLAGGFAAIAGLALLGLAAPAFGQTVVTFTGELNSSNQWQGTGFGVYDDPYLGTVTQPPSSVVLNNGPTPPQIICDDFNDDISPNESWDVTAVEASTLTSTNVGSATLFGGKIGVAGYAAMAYLVIDMLNQNDTNSATGEAEVAADSEAIWWIGAQGIDAAGTVAAPTTITDQGSVFTLSAKAAALVQTAYTQTASPDYLADNAEDLFVLKPTQAEPGAPQEMWIETTDPGALNVPIPTPEGGAGLLYLLLGGASCFGAMFLASRARMGRIVTA